jgi:hypothetical protein
MRDVYSRRSQVCAHPATTNAGSVLKRHAKGAEDLREPEKLYDSEVCRIVQVVGMEPSRKLFCTMAGSTENMPITSLVLCL